MTPAQSRAGVCSTCSNAWSEDVNESLLTTTGSSSTVRVLIAADDADLRAALKNTLAVPCYDVLAETPTLRQAIDLIEKLRPDILLAQIDVDSPQDRDALLEFTKQSAPPLVALVSSVTAATALAQQGQVSGFLLNPLAQREIIPTVQLAMEMRRRQQSLAERVADLEEALETRKLVERAKGILMDSHGLSEADAFRRMRRTSMDNRKTMREVAEAILLSHDLQLGSSAI